jgi:hypothetical protein
MPRITPFVFLASFLAVLSVPLATAQVIDGSGAWAGTVVHTSRGGTVSKFLTGSTVQPPTSTGECNLQVTVNCSNLKAGATGTCNATTLNAGNTACTGDIATGFVSAAPLGELKFSALTNTLGLSLECVNSADFPGMVTEDFIICLGLATLNAGASFTSSVQLTLPATITPADAVFGFSENFDASFNLLGFGYSVFPLTGAIATCTPSAFVPSTTQSGLPYLVSWTQTSDSNISYEIDESTSADFLSNFNMQTVNGALSKTYSHAASVNTTYYYRVRATNCGGGPGPFSNAVSIVVQAPPPPTSKAQDTVVPFGTTNPVQVASIFIPGSGASGKTTVLDTMFTAATDKPYLTVSPSSGTIPPGGTTVTVTANPGSLPPGANTGTVIITGASTSAPLQTTPVSVSLVTPVASQAKSTPPPNALIIPIVGHLIGGGGTPFQSDVRLTNAGSSPLSYQVTFTPTRVSSSSSKVTTIPVEAGQTIALNDVVKDFFGVGATGAAADTGSGSLEIRPLNSSGTLNFASSRTYATTSVGTFGQFIPAIPFSKFVTKVSLGTAPGMPSTANPTPLSLQQIAASAKFRTNLGLVEGSGAPVSGTIKVYDDAGAVLASVPYSLQAGEQQQNSLAGWTGVASLQDGRVEVTVDSATGAVSAYASVLDNITTDPLAVAPVQAPLISETRYVLPGVAEVDNGGLSNFHSDVRIFNGGSSPATVNLSYFEQISPNAAAPGAMATAQPITILPGHVQVLDNILPTTFNKSKNGGSVLLTTNTPSSLVVTGRTYTNDPKGGTFGQFIPGVAQSEGIGLNDRPLQILQLEQSVNFRSNIGIAELSGNPVTVRLFVSLPDSKVSIIPADITLPGNGFTQLQSFINSIVGTGKNTYNARIAVQVVAGTGRVTVYGSVIDNKTGDPTYVPAQ